MAKQRKEYPLLLEGRYEVIERKKGRRTVAIVREVGSHIKYEVLFKAYMWRHFVPKSFIEVDNTGEGIRVTKTLKNGKMP